MSAEERERIVALETHVIHIRVVVDALQKDLKGLMWKVIGIGTGSGALGFLFSMLVDRLS